MNVFEALRASHNIQRELSEKLVQTSGDSAECRELYDLRKHELFALAVAEDR